MKGFQEKREIAETGIVDRRTLDRLHGMTRTPTKDELANRLPGDLDTDAALDPRCLTGRALCVDKSSSTIRWVVDGKVRRTMAVRFGASYTPTREGLFHVGWKSRDHVSKLYDSAMPFAMFFSGGQAVHYSSDFAARGYAGASHGCVNVRDHAGIGWLFDQVGIGDKVVIYWSDPYRSASGIGHRVGSLVVTSPPATDAPAGRLVARTVEVVAPDALPASLLDLLPARSRWPGCVAARGWWPGASRRAAAPPGPTGSPTRRTGGSRSPARPSSATR